MSDIETTRRTLCEEATHEAFRIIEALQWHKHQPRVNELRTVGEALWRITSKLLTLRRITNA
jgi:hypothetical protein